MFLYAIDYVVGAIFPLITFPYVSRILGVENLGKYNFSVSIIAYLVLLAKLGISVYAIREGARIRDDKKKFNNFASQLFTINVISTVIVYGIFLLMVLIVPKFKDYELLLFVLSIQIFVVPLTLDWVYRIYEDFLFVTLRNLIYQIVSVSLLFVFVKTEGDLLNYAIVTVISATGANIFNFVCSRKYCRIKLTKKLELHIHIFPIVTLFAMTIANKIFDTSDIVLLGFMSGDRAVGIYSVAVKVYNIVKGVAASIVAVSIPRIASLLKTENESEVRAESRKIYNILLSISVPVVMGVFVLSEEIVFILSGEEYLDAVLPLRILAIDIFVSVVAYFWGQAILVPFKKDKVVLKVITVSAILNIVLNIILIPYFNEVATAVTTLLAELIWLVLCRKEGVKLVGKVENISHFLKVVVGSVPIVVFSFIFKDIIKNMYLYIVVLVVVSGIAYLLIELLLKNEVFNEYFYKLKKKIKHRRDSYV